LGDPRAPAASHRPGTLIVDGGGAEPAVRARLVELAGAPGARFVFVPTGASALKSRSGVILDPDWPRDRPEWDAFERELREDLCIERVTILHTRDRGVADSEGFVEPLRCADAVWLGPGNAGRYAAAYLDTRTHRELAAVLDRGAILGGTSAGAIILGSYTVRGRPDKPLLMASGHERGFGFLEGIAINPHLTSARRENELVDVVDGHPELLGIGIDDDAALVVRDGVAEVIGAGKVAIYDDVRRDGRWYYWLQPGDRFDLRSRTVIGRAGQDGVGSGGDPMPARARLDRRHTRRSFRSAAQSPPAPSRR